MRAGAWGKRGSTHAWRQLRRLVLERDRYRCRFLIDGGRECGDVATTVDHLEPLARGGELLPDPDTLRAACAFHNASEGAKLGNQLRREKRLRAVPRGWSW